MNLIKSLLVIVLMAAALAAQDETDGIFSIMTIEGKTCIATTNEEFETLTALKKLIDTMGQAKSNGTIDSTFHAEKVAGYMKDAREAGVIMTKKRKN